MVADTAWLASVTVLEHSACARAGRLGSVCRCRAPAIALLDTAVCRGRQHELAAARRERDAARGAAAAAEARLADMEQLQRDKAAALGAVQRLEVGAAASAASLAAARSQVPNLPYFNPRCPAAALLAPCRRQKISALLLISVNADCDAQL